MVVMRERYMKDSSVLHIPWWTCLWTFITMNLQILFNAFTIILLSVIHFDTKFVIWICLCGRIEVNVMESKLQSTGLKNAQNHQVKARPKQGAGNQGPNQVLSVGDQELKRWVITAWLPKSTLAWTWSLEQCWVSKPCMWCRHEPFNILTSRPNAQTTNIFIEIWMETLRMFHHRL